VQVSWEKLEKQQPRYIQRHKTQLRNEIACLQALRHPNIVRLLHHVNTPKYFIMYLEFCAGGDLAGALRKRKGEVVDEGLARRLVEMLAEGLREMRKLNWVHRDLKPGNLLLCAAPPQRRARAAAGQLRVGAVGGG
jgi:serine/threonine protein kinase